MRAVLALEAIRNTKPTILAMVTSFQIGQFADHLKNYDDELI